MQAHTWLRMRAVRGVKEEVGDEPAFVEEGVGCMVHTEQALTFLRSSLRCWGLCGRMRERGRERS